jgi:hypothetical protein
MDRSFQYILAKTLQVMGFLTMPWALWFGMAQDDMGSELLLLGLGGVVFFLGWKMEQAVAE